MKRNDWLSMTSVAVATAALTVLSNYGGALNAGADPDQPAQKIANPMLVLHGVEMTIQARDGRTFKAGDQPEFEFKAVNTTDKPASVEVNVEVLATPEISRFARVVPTSKSIWRQQQTLTLGPKENRSVMLATKTELPANRLFSVTLQEAGAPSELFRGSSAPTPLPSRTGRGLTGILALSFSTMVPKTPAENAQIVAAQ